MCSDVEVFRTNIGDSNGADRLKKELFVLYPFSRVSFDLEDCDKILRIEALNMDANQVIALGHHLGISIELLEDEKLL
jgi:hypothetical protein